MEILPSQIIGYRNVQSNGEIFHGYNPGSGKPLSPAFREATKTEINESIILAHNAFSVYRNNKPVSKKPVFGNDCRQYRSYGRRFAKNN